MPHLQLWQPYYLVSAPSVVDLHSQVLELLHFMAHEDAAGISETRQRLDDVGHKT
jgi:hypothetical protein